MIRAGSFMLASLPLFRAALEDLVVIEGEHSDCAEGYSKVETTRGLNGDLNQGAGGRYIWMCVQYGVQERPITDLVVVAEDTSDFHCGYLGYDWERIGQELGSNGDLNHGSGGKYIYMCFKRNSTKAPITRLTLTEQACPSGMTRVPAEDQSNGDLNQGAGGKYIFVCFKRACVASEVRGQWFPHGSQLVGTTKETWHVGVHQGTEETKTKVWKDSVTMSVHAGWVLDSLTGGFTVDSAISYQTSESFKTSWSQDDDHTFEVTFLADDLGKQPWQFQLTTADTCGQTTVSAVQSLAITEGAWRPPCCVPGYCTSRYCSACHSQQSMIFDAEAYGCKVTLFL